MITTSQPSLTGHQPGEKMLALNGSNQCKYAKIIFHLGKLYTLHCIVLYPQNIVMEKYDFHRPIKK